MRDTEELADLLVRIRAMVERWRGLVSATEGLGSCLVDLREATTEFADELEALLTREGDE